MKLSGATCGRLMGGAAVLAGCLLLVGATPADAQYGAQDGEWRSYGGDVGSTKYSPLDQITRDNFDQLEIAWRWTSVDDFLSMTSPDGGEWWADYDTIIGQLQADTPELYRERNTPNRSNLQATPLMVDGVLYLNTPLSQGVAVDATTGETIWVFNPKSYEEGTTSMTVTWRERGVAYWTDGADEERIFWGTGNGSLVCVHAKTGRPCENFGQGGIIDAMTGLPRAVREDRDYLNAMLFSIQSPPIVVRDTVIHGSSIADRRITKEAVPGWVRAWDVRTGEHKWDFHTVPASGDEYGADTWLNESWRYSGNANVWSMLSGDNELGYVYLPTGTPTNDYYGGHRLGDNLFAESLVAVDIETGQRVWHFQAVHHGLWDYDFPAAPNLLDIDVDGRRVRAIAQVSKQGFVYTFDRVTGDPIWPIEERPVITAPAIPGEVPAPTQPFPTKPPAFEYQGVTLDDLVDFTPEIRQMAVEAVSNFRMGPLFTAPTLAEDGGTQGTLFRPTGGGAASWTGAAVDPETGVLYVPSSNNLGVIQYYTPDPAIGGNLRYTHGQPEAARLRGGRGGGPRMPQGLPLLKPPYSRMTAIDMNRGENAWMQPLGNGDRIRNHPLLQDLDLPPLGGDGRGGPVLTKTLLVSALSAGGSSGGPRLVARDKTTGQELGSVDLPSGAIGTPMTYMVDGRQYIALTIGGQPPNLIAYVLPE
ncbi:MAG: pyrroloquinoline quinone-dependent dehydrogenase [Vicinamibacterales bacterium]|nr:pyrroloquinoline quinone-dependent dehydrogenase [Vicinamibacterales bacterium]